MASEASRIDDVSKLSNNKLFEELQRLGISAGPVVDSTRSVYEKKLLTKLSELRQSPVSSIKHTSGSPINNISFRESVMGDYDSEMFHNTTQVFRNSSESVDSLNLDDTTEADLNYSFTKRQTTPPASSIFQSSSRSANDYHRLSASEIVEDIRRRAALASRIQSRPSYRASESYQQGQFSGRVGKSETIKTSKTKISSTVIKILVGLILFGIFYYVMTYTVEKPKIEYKGDAEKILEESGYDKED